MDDGLNRNYFQKHRVTELTERKRDEERRIQRSTPSTRCCTLNFVIGDSVFSVPLCFKSSVAADNVSLRFAVPGDNNIDGAFNSGDLVHVFQVGEYEDGRECAVAACHAGTNTVSCLHDHASFSNHD
jgi:hypothetical protein